MPATFAHGFFFVVSLSFLIRFFAPLKAAAIFPVQSEETPYFPAFSCPYETWLEISIWILCLRQKAKTRVPL